MKNMKRQVARWKQRRNSTGGITIGPIDLRQGDFSNNTDHSGSTTTTSTDHSGATTTSTTTNNDHSTATTTSTDHSGPTTTSTTTTSTDHSGSIVDHSGDTYTLTTNTRAMTPTIADEPLVEGSQSHFLADVLRSNAAISHPTTSQAAVARPNATSPNPTTIVVTGNLLEVSPLFLT